MVLPGVEALCGVRTTRLPGQALCRGYLDSPLEVVDCEVTCKGCSKKLAGGVSIRKVLPGAEKNTEVTGAPSQSGALAASAVLPDVGKPSGLAGPPSTNTEVGEVPPGAGKKTPVDSPAPVPSVVAEEIISHPKSVRAHARSLVHSMFKLGRVARQIIETTMSAMEEGTGEVSENLETALAAIDMEQLDSLEDLYHVRRLLRGEEDMAKDYKRIADKRRGTCDKTDAGIKRAVLAYMARQDPPLRRIDFGFGGMFVAKRIGERKVDVDTARAPLGVLRQFFKKKIETVWTLNDEAGLLAWLDEHGEKEWATVKDAAYLEMR